MFWIPPRKRGQYAPVFASNTWAQAVDMSGVPSFTADTNVIIGGIGQKMRLRGVKHGTDADKLDRDYGPGSA